MTKLVFNYGVMGSSKSAQALISRYNYISKGFNVVLLKPEIDNRNDNEYRYIQSRIGLKEQCSVFSKNDNLINVFMTKMDYYKNNVIIVDEVQFCTKKQIDELKVVSKHINVFCYGLKTNFKSELFEGSKRLIEIADESNEITYICKCGKNAIINARIVNGKPTVDGSEVLIGGNEMYQAMCYDCWKSLLQK